MYVVKKTTTKKNWKKLQQRSKTSTIRSGLKLTKLCVVNYAPALKPPPSPGHQWAKVILMFSKEQKNLSKQVMIKTPMETFIWSLSLMEILIRSHPSRNVMKKCKNWKIRLKLNKLSKAVKVVNNSSPLQMTARKLRKNLRPLSRLWITSRGSTSAPVSVLPVFSLLACPWVMVFQWSHASRTCRRKFRTALNTLALRL